MKRTRKRTLLMVLLLLIGGAIINVAVAWAIAAYGPLLPFARSQDWVTGTIVDFVHCGVAVSLRARLGAAEVEWNPQTGRYFPGEECKPLEPYPDWLPSWTNVQSLQVNDQGFWKVTQFATGWPARTLMYEFCESYIRDLDDTETEQWHWSMPIETTPVRALPTLPIWPGFAINTVFYAAMLWLLFAGSGFVRRRFVIRGRVRRGQCPACAYPVGSSTVCTECGKALPSPSR